MLLNLLLLFFSVFITGYVVKSRAYKKELDLKPFLIFGGSFLFTITIIHLLPTVFSFASTHSYLPFLVLLGFFIQLLLEQFSQGAEHGHIHVSKDHGHLVSTPIVLVMSLSIHAFLEGTLLGQPSILEDSDHGHALLLGIILHKIPATIALITVLLAWIPGKKSVMVYLLVFAIASPLGLFLSHYLSISEVMTEAQLLGLFAVVSGNFLHISTTIFFESNPEHLLNYRKILISLLGAGVAVIAEVFL